MKKRHLFINKIFSLFCNKQDSLRLTRLLYERFEVESTDYEDDEIWEIVENYFLNKVIPHKIEVRKAGLELLKESWFSRLLSLADNAKTNNPVEQFKYNLHIHDLSKFSLQEAYGYAIHDFKNPNSTNTIFQRAWHHHKLQNPHHPENWLNVERNGITTPLPMPSIFIAEMIADWIGASKSYGQNFEEWLPKNLPQFLWHPYSANLTAEYLSMMGFKVRNDEQKLYLE